MDVLIAVIASSGFWAAIQLVIANRYKKDGRRTALEKATLALLHDRLHNAYKLSQQRDGIDIEELRNLDYIYSAYKALGGNGTGDEIYKRIKNKVR